MVFFTDKAGTPYSIENPEEFLSQRALDRRSAQRIEVTSEDLPISPEYIQALKDLGIDTFYPTKWMNGVLVQMTQIESQAVLNLPFVSSIEYVARWAPLQSGSTKSDIQLDISSNLAGYQQKMLGIDQMHDYGFRGEGILIAIFDDGFTNYSSLPGFQHILDENRLLYTFDFVNKREDVQNGEDHGTNVFSIIGADIPDYTGGAPKAEFILSVTEAPWEFRVEEYNWLFAAEKADSAGVDIINTSLGYKTGFTDPRMNYRNEQLDGQTAVITKASNIAASKGIVLVSSAGNSGQIVSAPADSPNVLAVGAITADSLIASFSSRGTYNDLRIKPDVVAQGVGTMLITSEGDFVALNGTSFSSPLMVGLVAGVWQAYPSKTAAEIREMIRMSGDRATNPDAIFGYGIPSFERVIGFEQSAAGSNANVYTAFPNPTQESIQLSFDEKHFGEQVTIQIVSGTGELKKQLEYIPFEARNPLQIDLEESGIYFLRVITNSKTSTRKIIKY